MNVYTAIEQRHSTRDYNNEKVPKEVIHELLLAASKAPSAKNRQPWKFIVFSGEDKNKLLDVMDAGFENSIKTLKIKGSNIGDKDYVKQAFYTLNVMKQAPVVIAILNVKNKSPWLAIENGDEHTTELMNTLSIGAAIENMLIRATELGLSTLWIGDHIYADTELQEFLGTDRQITSFVAVGYEDCKRAKKKPLNMVAEYRGL